MKTSIIFLCLVVSVGLANATIQNKSNPEKPAEITLSTAQGSTSFTYPPSPYGGDLPVYSSWNWSDGVGGSYSLISLVENGLPDSLWMGFEDYYSWGANGMGPYERWDDYYNVGLPPNRVLWDSGTSTFSGFPSENGSLSTNIPNFGFFSRNSKVTVELKTGGKSSSKRQNLFAITAGATGYQGLTPNEVNVPQPSDSYLIPASSIQVPGAGSLDTDGIAYAIFPDNSTVDITPKASVNYYSFSVSATKYKSYFDVFVDQPDPSGNHVWTMADSAGHAWWRFRSDAPSDALNAKVPAKLIPFLGAQVGYAPTNTATVTLYSPNAPAMLRDPETDMYFSVFKEYDVGFPDLIAGLHATKLLYDIPGEYGIYTFNCVDAVISAGATAGITLPNNKGGKSYSNPENFGKGLPPGD